MSTLLDAQLASRKAEVKAVLRAKAVTSRGDAKLAAPEQAKQAKVVASLKRAGILTSSGRIKTVKISQ